jgi:2-oxoglutarate ferredoxin oxidoreductase subunit beta
MNAPKALEHPRSPLLRMDRIPHIWCPTCGIGTTVNVFIQALTESGLDLKKTVVVSGIGCTGRVAGYINLDSFHTTHGRALPFATGMKLANPELTVVVFSGDGDLFAIGGNHFIHAARRNMDLKVFCVNNFIYGMTGGQAAPTTPIGARTTTTPFGSFEHPFNLVYMAASAGATYVARWTALHVRRLKASMKEALVKPGFNFVEIIAPCPTVYARRNRLGSGLDLMRYYRENSKVVTGMDPKGADIEFQKTIHVGKFVDIEKPTWLDGVNQGLSKFFGSKYVPYGSEEWRKKRSASPASADRA